MMHFEKSLNKTLLEASFPFFALWTSLFSSNYSTEILSSHWNALITIIARMSSLLTATVDVPGECVIL